MYFLRLQWLGLFFLSLEVKSTQLLIKKRDIQKNHICFHLCETFTKNYVRFPLRLYYPNDINLEIVPQSIVDIPLIANVIPVIWLSGQTYSIEDMDEDLYKSLVIIKEFFKRFFYNTSWNGELIPERLIKNNIPIKTNQPAALFSGGLDSTTTLFRHINENPILISFNQPEQKAQIFAQSLNLALHTIAINYYDFLKLTKLDKASIDISKWFWDTTMGLAWVGAAAPFLYAKGITTLYIPSGLTWQSFIFPDGQTLQQPACPLIDENMSPAGLHVYHDAFTMTRTDKISFISQFCSQYNIAKPQLIVCNYYYPTSHTKYTHCNHCFKCLITMLDIIAIGESLQDYGFTLSEREFINLFQNYMQNLTMRRGGTYAALRDTQNYIKQHINSLPEDRQAFYNWFISIDLWNMIRETSNRPLRSIPFDWNDYNDLYKK